ncbi:MAG: thrombospondin type 3 repeat-containing protein [Opitutaceae bacterium]
MALSLTLPLMAWAESHVTVLPRDYNLGTVANEWAQYTLDTSGTVTVKNGSNVTFSAGSSITLYPGFKIEAGATFKAVASYNPAYNPGGYYNTITPTLALIAGDQQYGEIGQFNLLPFDIAIWNEAGTAPLVNAPVLITVSDGGGWLSATNGANPVLTKTLLLTTDVDGTVHAYYQQGTTELIASTIRVVAGTQNWQFTTFSYTTTGENADTDGDGISNTAEAVAGTNATQPAQASTVPELLVFTP